MPEQHPITPPPELIEEWIELSRPTPVSYSNPNVLATYAARWGADQELEACCEHLQHPLHPKLIDALSEYKTCEESMRAAANWQLKKVIQAWEQCMKEPGTDIQVIRRFEQKLKAMRPTTTQEDN